MYKYYVFSEGFGDSNPLTDETKYFGHASLVGVDTQVNLDGEESWEYSDDQKYARDAYITDKWGGEVITNTPDDFDPEFTNGLINWGFFEDLDLADKAFDKLLKGTIEYKDLP